MRNKGGANVVGFGATLMLLAGGSNLLFHASPFRVSPGVSSSFSSSVVQAGTLRTSAQDLDEDDSCGDTFELAMARTAWQETQQRRSDSTAAVSREAVPAGGDIAPARYVADAYASLHSVAVDTDTNQVVMSDSHRGAIFFYDRTSGTNSSKMSDPNAGIPGPRTSMMFSAWV